VLISGHRVKCELNNTLVCIVIDGRNVSKTLTMRTKCEHRAQARRDGESQEEISGPPALMWAPSSVPY